MAVTQSIISCDQTQPEIDLLGPYGRLKENSQTSESWLYWLPEVSGCLGFDGAGGLALQAAPSPACEGRSGLQTARRCCLFNALRPPSVPDGISIPQIVTIQNKKPTLTDELFVLMVEAGGIEPPSASPLQAVLHT